MTEETNPAQSLLKTKVAEQAIRSTNFLRNDNGKDESSEIAVIKGLSSAGYLQIIEWRLRGYRYDYILNQWILFRDPVMNSWGIGNIMLTLQGVSDDIYFSNFDDKEIPRLAYHCYANNLPTFLLYAKDFGLREKDFNLVDTILFNFILSAFKNAKNAGHRNVVRGTLSENVFLKSLASGSEAQGKKGGVMSFLKNPFRREK